MDKRLSKFENIFDKVMQASMINQKNIEASMRNLETQVRQLAKQLSHQHSGQFFANTHQRKRTLLFHYHKKRKNG